ncbi:MAG: hypothetical protein IPM51_02620 [Sphingobacteriaceae bacterium]|nr:hypothetical protein [Sphingobacteriaceae bacterium]
MWIVIFIFISVFINSIVLIQQPFEFYLGYFIFIILLPSYLGKYGINRQILLIFTVLFISGLYNILLDNNTAALFFKVFAGMFISYVFYHCVVEEFKFDIEQLFKWYLKGCYIAALIGVFQFVSYILKFEPGYNYRWLFNKWGIATGGNFGIRINSIFGEPTYLAAVLSAAFFVSLHNLIRKKNFYLSKFQSVVIILAYLLSFSGLGQAGILLTVLFLAISYGFVRYIFIFIPVGILIFNVMYENLPDFRNRFESLYDLFNDGKFVLGKTHGSSFILYNNYHVATENFKTNFVFGTGLGSHPIAYEQYSIAKDIKVRGFDQNSADANSMLLRLISETGIFGVTVFLIIVFKCYVKRNPDNESIHWLISNSLLIMILLNLFRQGHYFLNGFPLFVIMYYYNYTNHQKYLEELDAEGQESLVTNLDPSSA